MGVDLEKAPHPLAETVPDHFLNYQASTPSVWAVFFF